MLERFKHECVGGICAFPKGRSAGRAFYKDSVRPRESCESESPSNQFLYRPISGHLTLLLGITGQDIDLDVYRITRL